MLDSVMRRLVAILIGFPLLVALPAAAQNSNPFREAAPPAPAPAPRLRRPTEPEPEVAAPQPPPAAQPAVAPVPSPPPARQIWARVRQVAAVEGIAVPLAGEPPFDVAGTPTQYRALLGGWGPGTWQGDPGGDKMILIVQGIDSDGDVLGIVGRNSPQQWTAVRGRMAAGRIAMKVLSSNFVCRTGNCGTDEQYSAESWNFQARPDGGLYGLRDGNKSAVMLARLR